MGTSQLDPSDGAGPWGAPDPTDRVEAASPVSVGATHRWRTRRIVLIASAAGFLIGTAGAAAIVSTHQSHRTIAPATTSPPVAGGTARPSAPPATPATGGQRSPAPTNLTVGVVNIDTVLAYERSEAAGTGIVLTSSGEVLTNNHVIDGATKITATVVATGKSYSASVVGTDPTDDIAVLRLADASGLATARLGDSSTVKRADQVTAVGNARGRGTATSATGVVVDVGQTVTASDGSGANAETLHNLIQISATLQPGESGGPLFDANGKVIGVDTAGATNGRFRFPSASTQGFAIPINDALSVAKQIEAGKVTANITIGTPPLLGIDALPNANGAGSGVTIGGVASGTPAAAIGLRAGDVIVAVGDSTITNTNDLSRVLHSYKAGDKVNITWTDTGNQRHTATATLIAGPAN